MDDDGIELVPHRKRSTPWDYDVVLAAAGRENLELYSGQCWWSARGAYWRAIWILEHYGLSGGLCMDLTEKRKPYGGFKTELHGVKIDGGRHHIPDGDCRRWAYMDWTTLTIAQKALATIPGKLRPVRHRKSN
jgi:hypothetical protein